MVDGDHREDIDGASHSLRQSLARPTVGAPEAGAERVKDKQSSVVLGSFLASLCAYFLDHETASPRLLELSEANINLWSQGAFPGAPLLCQAWFCPQL